MKDLSVLSGLFADHLSTYTAALSGQKPAELYEPEQYILSLGGKRLRPLLALMACEVFNGAPEKALDAALAVELFHNFSLVHDDILDAAPLRRGKETIHTRWNQNIAILSGDVMLVKSMQVLASYEPPLYLALCKIFQITAVEVCEGQQMDMNFESTEVVQVADYIEMISRKTAVLLGCSLQMGAIIAGTSAENQKLIYEFGRHLGIAFQLLDDLLDAFATADSGFGKQIGGDILANKKTYLLLKAIELANAGQKSEIITILALPPSQEKVVAMLRLYDDLSISAICRQEADHHTSSAIASLEALPISAEHKAALQGFANQLLNRLY